MIKNIFFSVIILLVCALQINAMERFEVLSTEEMQKLIAAKNAGHIDFVLVHASDEMIYRHSTIPGSVNIPLAKVDTLIKELGSDLSSLIITYCIGYR
jgi:hypothetical protein